MIAGCYNREVLYWPGTRREIPETLPGKLKVRITFKSNY